MRVITAERVWETSTTTGTGAYTLAGAVTNYRAFSAVMADADFCDYIATMGNDWESGVGRWNTGGTLTRMAVIDSSNSGSAVNWGSGTKDIFMHVGARRLAYPRGCRVKRTSDQTIVEDTDTAMSWQAEDYDTNGSWASSPNPTRLTVPSGWAVVRVLAHVDWDDGSGFLNEQTLWVTKNGSIFEGSSRAMNTRTAGPGHLQWVHTAPVVAAPDDYFEVLVRQHQNTTGNADALILANTDTFAVLELIA